MVFVQCWNEASVSSLIRYSHSGEFQWNVSDLQFLSEQWCSSLVQWILFTLQFHSVTPHKDKSGVQVGSRPLHCHTESIHDRVQEALQNDVLADCCHYWPSRTDDLSLTWKENRLLISISAVNAENTCLRRQHEKSLIHLYMNISGWGAPGHWRHQTESSGPDWVSHESSWSSENTNKTKWKVYQNDDTETVLIRMNRDFLLFLPSLL